MRVNDKQKNIMKLLWDFDSLRESQIMKLCNCSETDILYIGDSIYDRQCAQAANCAFALALWGAKKRMAGVRAYGMPDEILRSLT